MVLLNLELQAFWKHSSVLNCWWWSECLADLSLELVLLRSVNSADSRSRIHVGSGYSSLSVVQQNLQLSLKNLQDSLSSMDLQNQSSELAGLPVGSLCYRWWGWDRCCCCRIYWTLHSFGRHCFVARTKIGSGTTFVSGDSETEQPESTQASQLSTFGGGAKLLDSIQQKKPFFTNLELPNQLSELARLMPGSASVSGVAEPVITLSFVESGNLAHSVVVLNPEQLMLSTLFERHGGATESFSKVTTMLKETQQFLVKQRTSRLLLATISPVMLDALVVRQLRSRLMIISDLVSLFPQQWNGKN